MSAAGLLGVSFPRSPLGMIAAPTVPSGNTYNFMHHFTHNVKRRRALPARRSAPAASASVVETDPRNNMSVPTSCLAASPQVFDTPDLSEPPAWPIPESLIEWAPERWRDPRDPHGCCGSCLYCVAQWKLEDLRRLLTASEPEDRRSRVWPGPRGVCIESRRYFFLGRRDGFGCFYCRKQLPVWSYTLDHVTPRSRGGLTTPDNLVLACVSCNSSKGARTPEEWIR